MSGKKFRFYIIERYSHLYSPDHLMSKLNEHGYINIESGNDDFIISLNLQV